MRKFEITALAPVFATPRRVIYCLMAASLIFAIASTAHAQTAQVKAGTLTCKGKGKVGLILGSKESLDCTYSPADGRPSRRLRGTITNIGLDVGVTGKSVMVWGCSVQRHHCRVRHFAAVSREQLPTHLSGLALARRS